MLSKENIHQKIFYYLLLLQAFAFPLWRRILPLLMVLILLNVFIEFRFVEKIKTLFTGKKLRFLLLFISLYLLYLLGLLYTSNFNYAGFDLEVKLTFLLIPIFLFVSSLEDFSKDKVINILIVFVIACFISSFISTLRSAYLYYDTGDNYWMFYVYVSYFIHPSYMSMYIVFAMAVIVIFLMNGLITNKRLKYFMYFLLFWFVFYNILLTAKAGIICMLIITILLIVYWIIKKRKIVLAVITAFIFILLVGIGISKFSFLTNRVKATIQAFNNSERDINEEDGTVQRIEIWKTSIQLIKDNFLIGVGTGDVKDELLKRYDANGMTFAKNKNLNAHSQYFQTFITLGIFGFIALLSLFIFPLIHAFKNRNFIYLFFLLIVAINIAVESMFENQAGVLFYTFFNTFLFLTVRQLADKNQIN